MIDFTDIVAVTVDGYDIVSISDGTQIIWEKPVTTLYPLHIINNTSNAMTMSVTNTGSSSTTLYTSSNALSWTSSTAAAGSSITITVPGDSVLYLGTVVGGRPNLTFRESGTTTNYNYSLGGHLMSLVDLDNFRTMTYFPTASDSYFYELFGYCSHLTNASELIIPSYMCDVNGTALENCYGSFFTYCTGLTEGPALPATSLGTLCYSAMFSGCSSLTVAPDLPATNVPDYAYYYMFIECTSLMASASMSATTLGNSACDSMYMACTSLTTVSQMSISTLSPYSCYSMFGSCTSLINGGVWTARTLASSSYSSLFNGCTSLQSVTSYATDITSEGCLSNWLSNVPNGGTLYVPSEMVGVYPANSYSGIPSGWSYETI